MSNRLIPVGVDGATIKDINIRGICVGIPVRRTNR